MSISDAPITPPARKTAGRFAKLLLIAAPIAAAGLAYVLLSEESDGPSSGTTFVARRGNLDIAVLEGGSLEALESQEIRSRVRGRQGTKILEIVEEGYQVTEEDVANEMILVRLDSSDMEDYLIGQEIGYEKAKANFIEAQNAYEIQVSQNESNIKDAELKVKFAQMDFEKYLGVKAVSEILVKLKLDEKAVALEIQRRNLRKPQSVAALDVAPDGPGGPANGWQSELARGRPGVRARGRQGDSAWRRDGGEGQGRRMRRDPDSEGGSAGTGSGPAQAPPEPQGAPKTQGGGIALTDELLEAISQNLKDRGTPMNVDRFKKIISGRAEEDGMLSPDVLRRMRDIGIDIRAIENELNGSKESASGGPESSPAEPAKRFEIDLEYMDLRQSIDFGSYADVEVLEDGQAKQDLRNLEQELLVAQQVYELRLTELEGKQRLAEKDFVTPVDLEREVVRVEESRLNHEKKRTAQPLYIRYEFPKRAEKLLSDYENSLMQMGRTMKQAFSQLAQKEARLRSAESQYWIELYRMRDTSEQIANCTIRAERPGLVVYGTSSGQEMYRRGASQEPIGEGVTVHERQLIITIPDMTLMAARVKIHEAAIQKVHKGQTAKIIIDSRPEEPLFGEVIKVNVMPDANDRWMNPDMKVFSTMVQIEGVYDWIRPGMSAQVEILIETLEDVVYIPIQAVSADGQNKVCYVATEGGGPEQRIIEVGPFTHEFIEVKSNLAAGEVVYLRAPDVSDTHETDESDSREDAAPKPASADEAA